MLKLIKPSLCPLITLQSIKNYLRIDDDEDDAQLALLVEAATSLVEQEIGQTLLSKIWQCQGRPTLGKNGLMKLSLPNPPILRILSVGEVQEDGNVCSLRHFVLEADASVPTLAVAKYAEKLDVVYQAGFGEEPSSVPAVLRQAVLMLAADMYECRTTEHRLAPNSIVRVMLDPFKTRTLN